MGSSTSVKALRTPTSNEPCTPPPRSARMRHLPSGEMAWIGYVKRLSASALERYFTYFILSNLIYYFRLNSISQFITSFISLKHKRDCLNHKWDKLLMLRPSLEKRGASLHVDCNFTANYLWCVHNLNIRVETRYTHNGLSLADELDVVTFQSCLQCIRVAALFRHSGLLIAPVMTMVLWIPVVKDVIRSHRTILGCFSEKNLG